MKSPVSPVHAGIYPMLYVFAGGLLRFPRSCGDIPTTNSLVVLYRQFPPFMRGYTSIAFCHDSGSVVSPVHAGIYLRTAVRAVILGSFPRSCGDIPAYPDRCALSIAFPPFMRGYTLNSCAHSGKESVSPVHAGIYPDQAPISRSAPRFPRSCGDIPSDPDRRCGRRWFPPFMRGYTLFPIIACWLYCVSPVHAGIYLKRLCSAAWSLSFPRSCGDIPCP